MRKPNLPPGAEYLSNGPVSTVFVWHDKCYRFGQGRRGGTIYAAHPTGPSSIIWRAYWRREVRRMKERGRETDE